MTNFACWIEIDQLRLVANTVKHGHGRSLEELESKYPKLFEELTDDDFPKFSFKPEVRPLTGEGLKLKESHFSNFSTAIEKFWGELADALFLVYCPKLLIRR